MKRLGTKLILYATLASAVGILGACSYGSISLSASADKVIITRNDMLLFGILRKVYVCKVTDAGLTDCRSHDNP